MSRIFLNNGEHLMQSQQSDKLKAFTASPRLMKMVDQDQTREEEREEIARHDELYRENRPANLVMVLSDWQKFDDDFDTISPYIASIQLLGDVSGLRVLDVGCGDGWLSVILAKRGAIVEGFDISKEGIITAQARAEANGVAERCSFQVASIYSLPYPPERFDLVAGQAILHHVCDKARVAAELYRVMKPGARAAFHETFGNSLWLERLRLLVPIKSGAEDDPTEWKKQFKYRDLEPFSPLFEVRYQEWHFFSRLDRILSSPKLIERLGRLDKVLLRHLPWLRSYARQILVEMVKRPSLAA
jgi:2-polyprenyl-3-methyl-5-hydroxy-6-metoxy-1,4-benzoquinol methylase